MGNLTINEGTQAAINFDLNGTINTQVIALGYGTLSTIGTLPTLNIASGSINGTVNIGNTPNIGTIGTLGLGSVVVNSLPNTPGGTLGSILGIGSVSGLSNLPGGTLNLITTVTNLSNGTIQNSGTVTGVGSISNIGSIAAITSGTIQNSGTVTGVGSVSSLGSLGVLNNGTVVNNGGSVQITDNTNIANVANLGTGSYGTANQNAILTGGAFMEKAALSASSLNGDLVSSLDVSNYSYFNLQVSGTFVGTLTTQWSNDNSNFNSGLIVPINAAQNSNTIITANGGYVGPVFGRYLRVRMTSYTSGTANGVLEAHANGAPLFIYPGIVGAQQNGAWNIGTIGTLGLGTITGNLGTMGTLGLLANGTLANSGTTTGVGTVTNIGTLNQLIPGTTSNTLGKAGSTQSYAAGDTGVLMLGQFNNNFNINAGTNGQYTPLMTDQFGELFVNVGQGVIQINQVPTQNVLTYGTVSSGTIGTLIAAPGIGTSIFVCGISVDGDVTALGTANVVISFGTIAQGAGVLHRGGVLSTTPLVKTFPWPINGGVSNTPLTWLQTANAGTLSFTVQYFLFV